MPDTPPTWTLALDTASVVAAALACDGELVAEQVVDDTRAHTEQLMPLVVGLCERAGIEVSDLSRVVVGVGPGPFTGLRVGIVTALALGSVGRLPVRGVCSLDVVARGALDAGAVGEGEFVACLDARRKEVYWARYDATGARLDGPHVGPPGDLPALHLTGPGVAAHGLAGVGPTVMSAAPAALHDLPDAGLEPLYLRSPDAAVPTARKSTLLPPRPLRPRRDRRGGGRPANEGDAR